MALPRSGEVRIANRMSEIIKVADLVDAFAATHRLPKDVTFALNVALDEILNNVISYAYAHGAENEIVVRLAVRQDNVEAVVHDKGKPFNPLKLPTTKARAEDRIGGVGLRFVRSLTDKVQYMRRNGVNQLRLIK